ncbi:MAG TPA: hypothetical protein VF167_09700 [Longimicrobiaceae bacterium]
MEITVSTNATEVSQFLRDLYADQVPFATSRALNAAALAFQTKQRGEMSGRFTVRRKQWVDRSIKMRRTDFATKRSLEAFVRVETPGDPSRSDILAQHEDGGTKRPKDGGHLAIPQDVRRTGAGVIRKDQRPKAFGFRPHGSSGRVFVGDKRTVLIYTGGGGGVILQRQGRRGKGSSKRGGLRLLYRFTSKADLDERLRFVETAHETAPAAFARAFPEEFAKAVRSAR